jgi:hypothetical protein
MRRANWERTTAFIFGAPRELLNLRAQNLALFVQIAEGVDDSTWLHHLRAGDYSRWLKDKIKDGELADEVAGSRAMRLCRHRKAAAASRKPSSAAIPARRKPSSWLGCWALELTSPIFALASRELGIFAEKAEVSLNAVDGVNATPLKSSTRAVASAQRPSCALIPLGP